MTFSPAIHCLIRFPDCFSGSPFAYTIAIAPPDFSSGQHIGPAAINRNNVSAYVQDTWKVTPRFTLDYGLRWDLYTPITERARRTAGFRTVNGVQEYVVNPQPGYQTNWHAFEPRVQASVQVTHNLQAHAGGGIMVIPPNIWQDNFLTGTTPFAIYPRVVATAGAPIQYGFQITPDQLPGAYTPSGIDIFAKWKPLQVPANTVMDVDRYEKDLAALTHVVQRAEPDRHRSQFRQRHDVYLDRWGWSGSSAISLRMPPTWAPLARNFPAAVSPMRFRALRPALHRTRNSTAPAMRSAALAWRT